MWIMYFHFMKVITADFILSGTDFELFAYSIKLKCCSDVLRKTCDKDLHVVLNSLDGGKAGVFFQSFYLNYKLLCKLQNLKRTEYLMIEDYSKISQ